MSEIVPSPPDSGRITIRRVSSSPATTTVLLIAAVALALLWRTTEDARFQLLGNLDDNQLLLDELKNERDELNRKIGELEQSLADTRAKLDFSLSERDVKTSELETTREALAQLREQQAVDKVNIEQLNTLLIEAESARDKAIAERDEVRMALAKALEENETDDLLTERDEARADLAERDQRLNSTDTELVNVRSERDSAVSERDAAQAELKAANDTITERDNELAGAQGQLESVNTELEVARAQQSRAHSVLTLEGLLQERTFPKASFYRAKGTIELDTGAWAFVPGDIGGLDTTRAGEASVSYTVIPSSCIRELDGDWPGALVLDCPATVEWTIESRYPHFLLNILPLADSITVPEEVEATQDE